MSDPHPARHRDKEDRRTFLQKVAEFIHPGPDSRDELIETLARDWFHVQPSRIALCPLCEAPIALEVCERAAAAGRFAIECSEHKVLLSERGGAPCADMLVKDGDLVCFGRHSLEVRETPEGRRTLVTMLLEVTGAGRQA